MTLEKVFVQKLGTKCRKGCSIEIQAIRSFRTRNLVQCAVLIVSVIVSPESQASPQQNSQDKARSGDSYDLIQSKVRAEAAKLDKINVSPLFAATTTASADPALRLRSKQVEICRKFESLTRDIIRTWLLRGLDAAPYLDAGQIEARLSDRGVSLREDVVSHAEAMILEGVLDPDQAQVWYKASRTKPKPSQPSRSTPRSVSGLNTSTTAQLIHYLKVDAQAPRDLGGVFNLIPGAFVEGGKIAGQFDFSGRDNKRQSPENGAGRKSDPTPEQVSLSGRLESLAKEITAAWMVRGFNDAGSVPSRDTLISRIQKQPFFVNRLLLHAESIACNAILTPEQSERVLAVLWLRMGTSCLLDPALATLLRLTPQQRDDIRQMIAATNQLSERLAQVNQPLMAQLPDHPELTELHLQIDRDARNQLDAAESEVWNLLTPAQLKTLKRILAASNDLTPGRQVNKPQ